MSKPYLFPVLAIHIDGTVDLFRNMNELVDNIHNLECAELHHVVREIDTFGERSVVSEASIIVRDDSGQVVEPASIIANVRKNWFSEYRREKRTKALHAERLGLPIPGIRHRRGFRMFRRPKTLQELRSNSGFEADKAELPVHFEKFRLRKELPTYYDDIIRHHEKGWKKHRRYQWKHYI